MQLNSGFKETFSEEKKKEKITGNHDMYRQPAGRTAGRIAERATERAAERAAGKPGAFLLLLFVLLTALPFRAMAWGEGYSFDKIQIGPGMSAEELKKALGQEGVAVNENETASAVTAAESEQETAATSETAAASTATTTTTTTTRSATSETSATTETAGSEDKTAKSANTAETGNTGNTADTAALVFSNGRTIDPSGPMVALTFDDGPNAKVGNRIMDVLGQYNGRATFFVVGNRVRSYPEEMNRMVREGHEIGNHSNTHAYFNKCGADTIRSEVAKCNAAIVEVTGITPTVMRLPGGNKNSTVLENVAMPIILWNVDTRDWATKNARKTIDCVLGSVRDGDVILMHELYNATADACDTIIPELAARGYQMVTVSEMAQFKGAELRPHKVIFSF